MILGVGGLEAVPDIEDVANDGDPLEVAVDRRKRRPQQLPVVTPPATSCERFEGIVP